MRLSLPGFGSVHRPVRAIQQSRSILAVIRGHRPTYARRHLHRPRVDHARRPEGLGDAINCALQIDRPARVSGQDQVLRPAPTRVSLPRGRKNAGPDTMSRYESGYAGVGSGLGGGRPGPVREPSPEVRGRYTDLSDLSSLYRIRTPCCAASGQNLFFITHPLFAGGRKGRMEAGKAFSRRTDQIHARARTLSGHRTDAPNVFPGGTLRTDIGESDIAEGSRN